MMVVEPVVFVDVLSADVVTVDVNYYLGSPDNLFKKRFKEIEEYLEDYRILVLASSKDKFKNVDKNLTLAVMGCPVNGPGEAKNADIGVAGGEGFVYIFKKGEIIMKSPENEVLSVLEKLIDEI